MKARRESHDEITSQVLAKHETLEKALEEICSGMSKKNTNPVRWMGAPTRCSLSSTRLLDAAQSLESLPAFVFTTLVIVFPIVRAPGSGSALRMYPFRGRR